MAESLTVKLYTIRKWNELFENNRSRELVNLRWTVIPNRHDGETYTRMITHKDGSKMFSAWVLILQVASKCEPRGTLVRGDGSPLDSVALSLKTRAPMEWFNLVLEWLEKHSDWLEVTGIPHMGAGFPHPPDVHPAPRDDEGKGREGNRKEGKANGSSPEFEAFWKMYPKKVAKPFALKAWAKIDPKEFPLILEAVPRHLKQESWRKDDGKFIPHPATWLNQSRWLDSLDKLQPAPTMRVGSTIQ